VVDRRVADLDPGLRRAGEGDLVHAGMRGERLPDRRPVSRDHVEDAVGKPASCTRAANSSVEIGVWSDGLTTNVQPAASAGASFHAISSRGEFHGTIAPTTPTGSCRVYTRKFGRSDGIADPSSLSARPEK
jgi:hypothetical protein